ncbi:MAG: DUF4192 domain-containing protein [Nocardioides sp.]|uniref:DUF4192 domain-containing protein n=1 Tax=Nocardioides sp. TaxID=35761 RepID=UPI003F119D47
MNHTSEGPTMVVRSPGDFVAFVPAALGFVPADSVVMLTFDVNGSSFHARVDHDRDDPDGLAQALLRPAIQHSITAVVLLFYVEDDAECVEALGWQLRDTFVDAGLEVLEVLRVDRTHWYGVLPGHHPAAYEGVAHDLSSHRFTAQSVVAGRVLFPDRAALAASVEAAAVGEREFASCVEAARPLAPHTLGSLARRRAGQGERFSDDELANVVRSLADGHRRDHVWSHLDRARAVGAVDLWRDAAQRVPDRWAADVCAVLAFVAWLSGDGALAWCAVDRARRCRPDHSLARLVAGLLEQAQHPGQWEHWRRDVLKLPDPAA